MKIMISYQFSLGWKDTDAIRSVGFIEAPSIEAVAGLLDLKKYAHGGYLLPTECKRKWSGRIFLDELQEVLNTQQLVEGMKLVVDQAINEFHSHNGQLPRR